MSNTTEKITLPFGCNKALPENCRIAWGARMIFPDDLLPDRQGCAGGEPGGPDRSMLLDWLGSGVGDEMRENAKALAGCYQMKPDSNETFLLYEDARGVVYGSPQGSYGYLYVCAYLHEHCR